MSLHVYVIVHIASSCADQPNCCCLQIFQGAYIPRRLEEVDDHEGDFERLAAGGDKRATEGIYYQTIAGMRPDMTGAAAAPAVVEAAALLPGNRARPGSSASDEEDFDLEARLSGAAGRSAEARPAGKAEQHTSEADPAAAKHNASGGSDSSDSSSDEESDSDEDGEDGGEGREERVKKDPEAEKAARKQHKAEVKEANREKRKHKLKKHVKKRAINKHKHK